MKLLTRRTSFPHPACHVHEQQAFTTVIDSQIIPFPPPSLPPSFTLPNRILIEFGVTTTTAFYTGISEQAAHFEFGNVIIFLDSTMISILFL